MPMRQSENDLFAMTRFAHYLLAMSIGRFGAFMERARVEAWLSSWLERYVGDPDAGGGDHMILTPLARLEPRFAIARDSGGA
jgi:predicted component of type VI protein secretion system